MRARANAPMRRVFASGATSDAAGESLKITRSPSFGRRRRDRCPNWRPRLFIVARVQARQQRAAASGARSGISIVAAAASSFACRPERKHALARARTNGGGRHSLQRPPLARDGITRRSAPPPPSPSPSRVTSQMLAPIVQMLLIGYMPIFR